MEFWQQAIKMSFRLLQGWEVREGGPTEAAVKGQHWFEARFNRQWRSWKTTSVNSGFPMRS